MNSKSNIDVQRLLDKYRCNSGDGSTSIKYVPTPSLIRARSAVNTNLSEPVSSSTSTIPCPMSTIPSSMSTIPSSMSTISTSNSSASSLHFSTSKPPPQPRRYTPRVAKKSVSPLSTSNTHDKSVQTVSPHCNNENVPPDISLLETINKLKTENEKLRSENSYLSKQVQKMQAESSATAPQMETEKFGNEIHISNVKYDVDKNVIGKGASCVVYRGYDKAREDMVAIKVVSLRKLRPVDKQEIKREVELLQLLKMEDYIINLLNYEFQSEKARLFLVLEYGETDLNTYLQRTVCLRDSGTKLSYYQVCLLWQQMLQAVRCIHKHNIVHKDLKPQNFLMVKGKLKLIDFGISQKISDEVTSMVITQPEGTPNYIAPEMLSGTFGMAKDNILSYRSDVFSLGCILYKMCYGVTPYQHVDKMPMKYAAITSPESIPIPEDLKFPDIRQVLRLCLDKNRRTRPTIDELLEM